MGNHASSTGCCANASEVCLCEVPTSAPAISRVSRDPPTGSILPGGSGYLVQQSQVPHGWLHQMSIDSGVELLPDLSIGYIKGADVVSPLAKPVRLLAQVGQIGTSIPYEAGLCNDSIVQNLDELFGGVCAPTPSFGSRGSSSARDSSAGEDDDIERVGRGGEKDLIPVAPPEFGIDAAYEGPIDAGGQWHGSGVLTWTDGRRYTGQFRHGHMEGEATMSWPDGRVYAGQYRGSQKHGQGIFTWPDGRRYVGQWDSGHRHGCGLYTNAKGEGRLGNWVKDQPLSWERSTSCTAQAVSSVRNGQKYSEIAAEPLVSKGGDRKSNASKARRVGGG